MAVRVENRTTYPSAEVRRIVEHAMTRSHTRTPRVVVLVRRSTTDDRLGFTPFDSTQPIKLWVEPASRYPQPGARTWQEELAKSAAHEDYHFTHPNDPCPHNKCENTAEHYANRHFRLRGLYRTKRRRRVRR